jgi:thymidine kinase
MSLTLIIGPMFSSKTTTLCEFIDRAMYTDQKCIMVKYIKDNRYSDEEVICTHKKIYKIEHPEKLKIFAVDKLSDIDIPDDVHHIGIDEGQFYPDLYILVTKWLYQKKHIYIAALNGDFMNKPFKPISDTLSFATNIIFLKAICMFCKSKDNKPVDAVYTVRTIQEKKIELIGSDNIYKASCLNCMIKYKLSQTNLHQQITQDE